MTLSVGQPGFKICPNCKGEGSENNPPMRRCGVCKGTGHVPDEGPTDDRRDGPTEASAPKQEAGKAGADQAGGAQ